MMKVKIYTKTGDQGKTTIIGSKKIWKDDLRVEVTGQIDELSSWLGFLKNKIKNLKIRKQFENIQLDLMLISASIAQSKVDIKKINTSIFQLEHDIDQMDKQLPELQQFILPGGGEVGSQIHIVRAICRRVERRIVSLNRKEKLTPEILIYLNRLSDYFFVLARFINKNEKIKEDIYKKINYE